MMNSFDNHMFFGPGPFWGIGILGILGSAFFLVLIVAIIALKGYALWHAAKRDERWWFVVMLIINTAGILELVYLLFVVKRWPAKLTGQHTDAPHVHEKHENHHG